MFRLPRPIEDQLRYAIRDRNIDKVIHLLDSITFTHEELERAILLALDQQSNIIIDILLKYGANPNTQDIYSRSLLYLATYEGNIDIVDTILQYGADPNLAENSGGLSIGDTPLIVACRTERIIVEKLLNAGASEAGSVQTNRMIMGKAHYISRLKQYPTLWLNYY